MLYAEMAYFDGHYVAHCATRDDAELAERRKAETRRVGRALERESRKCR